MKINRLIDHTYLKAFATRADIDKLLEEAKTHNFKSVCVKPTHVKYCSEVLEESKVLVCTVIGFPLGANTVETKVFETLNAVSNGADEIDMVINIGKFKDGDYDYVEDEINQVCKAAIGKTVKVIVEICYLTDEEIVKASEIVARTNARYIKTSTGFGTGGATKEAVKLMKDNAGGKKVKAAGGVRNLDDLDNMLESGATRIGTSGGVKLMQVQENQEDQENQEVQESDDY
ncbi:MAG: deoxyribose-phosphate aldolase [Tenericutes bacterium]|nr:deoxyribose-phosphate aldolase [Mycoplasmatota bacterium]